MDGTLGARPDSVVPVEGHATAQQGQQGELLGVVGAHGGVVVGHFSVDDVFDLGPVRGWVPAAEAVQFGQVIAWRQEGCVGLGWEGNDCALRAWSVSMLRCVELFKE